jgi:hypothetical protein
MKQLVFPVLVAFLTISCVLKSDYHSLKASRDSLRIENDSIKQKLSKYISTDKIKSNGILETLVEQSKRRVTRSEPPAELIVKYYTDDEALETVKDWYSFYRADYLFQNERIRRMSANTFLISLSEAYKTSADMKELWSAVVWKLTIKNDGRYSVEPFRTEKQ